MNHRFGELAKGMAQSVTRRGALVQARMFWIVCAVALGMGTSSSLAAEAEHSADAAPAKTSLPWSQIGVKAGAYGQGDGLAVTPTPDGARLRCDFQRLEGEATREGLWLTSTVEGNQGGRFRVMATVVGRAAGRDAGEVFGVLTSASGASESFQRAGLTAGEPAKAGTPNQLLPRTGTTEVADKLARFIRPGLTEEYTVSVDGVRQDFIIDQRPVGAGALRVELDVTGAKVEPLAFGVRLVLENSGRKLAYSRLRVTDATSKELSARMEVMGGMGHWPVAAGDSPGERSGGSEFKTTALHSARATAVPLGESPTGTGGSPVLPSPNVPAPVLTVLVNDAEAVYPVHIDPTFSDANWISMNPSIPGTDSAVHAAVVDDFGNLYISGTFSLVGGVIANFIGKWNGSNWTALGSGMNGPVSALAVSGTDVYAGGSFTAAGGSPANNIARWNGSSWTALGSGMDAPVLALVAYGSDLYAGGAFTTADGSGANHIARWDGSSWTSLGSGMDGGVYALAVSGSQLYAGGFFSTAGETAANKIAKWNGSSWSTLASGMNDGVWALAVSGSDLYAGGQFTTAGGSAANRIAKWNGNSWMLLGSALNDRVNALAVSGSDVYVGGFFTTAGGGGANYIAKWNGSGWTTLGSGMEVGPDFPSVSALAVSGGDVYAGGYFTTAGGSAANYIAKWNGNNWTALGSGMNNVVGPLAVSGIDVYAGGAFTTAGDRPANYIAKWNGSSWTTLGSGMNNNVNALAVSGSEVYAGGYFTTAGDRPANYIAQWNGSDWSALGPGIAGGRPFGSAVFALAVSGSDLYAGGNFTTAGGIAANNIAQWNGSSWSALGSGMNSYVYALAVLGSDLYVGGDFTTAGGIAANYIAKWNGSSWSELGSGMNSVVNTLAVSGSDLYAGGYFTTAGDSAANYIAKWDGSSWSELGSGMNRSVNALAVSGSDLYAGGWFTTAGDSAANYIAKWNGSNWSALGSGMGGGSFNTVYSLAVSGSDLYAGGYFTTAGGTVSAYIARVYLLTLPTLSVIRSGPDVMVSWPSADTAGFTLDQAATLASPASWTTNTTSVADDGANKSVTISATNSPQFFRLRRP